VLIGGALSDRFGTKAMTKDGGSFATAAGSDAATNGVGEVS
jgi:hypothetical protein